MNGFWTFIIALILASAMAGTSGIMVIMFFTGAYITLKWLASKGEVTK